MIVAATLVAGIALSCGAASGVALPAGSAIAAAPSRASDARLSETLRLRPDADRLAAQFAGNIGGLRAAGQNALAVGRNDATVADFLRLHWVGRLDAGLERYGQGLAATDRAPLALAVAGVEHYALEIRNGVLRDGPSQLITVSLQAQRLVAYDSGRTVVEGPVTTGRPSLPTDIGAMRILRKDAPWTMQSPWPKGSPDWYPDTTVQMVLWFTKTGEGLHDASWQPDSTLGPGSQTGPFASHGCIHLPLSAVRVLFDWAPLGTPVVVYPGDGSPMAVQAAQQSVDAAGNPITGVRGA